MSTINCIIIFILFVVVHHTSLVESKVIVTTRRDKYILPVDKKDKDVVVNIEDMKCPSAVESSVTEHMIETELHVWLSDLLIKEVVAYECTHILKIVTCQRNLWSANSFRHDVKILKSDPRDCRREVDDFIRRSYRSKPTPHVDVDCVYWGENKEETSYYIVRRGSYPFNPLSRGLDLPGLEDDSCPQSTCISLISGAVYFIETDRSCPLPFTLPGYLDLGKQRFTSANSQVFDINTNACYELCNLTGRLTNNGLFVHSDQLPCQRTEPLTSLKTLSSTFVEDETMWTEELELSRQVCDLTWKLANYSRRISTSDLINFYPLTEGLHYLYKIEDGKIFRSMFEMKEIEIPVGTMHKCRIKNYVEKSCFNKIVWGGLVFDSNGEIKPPKHLSILHRINENIHFSEDNKGYIHKEIVPLEDQKPLDSYYHVLNTSYQLSVTSLGLCSTLVIIIILIIVAKFLVTRRQAKQAIPSTLNPTNIVVESAALVPYRNRNPGSHPTLY